MNNATERMIRQIYNEVFKKIYTRRNLSKLASGSKVEILSTANLLESSKQYEDFAKKFSIMLAKKGLSRKRGIWRKYYLAARRLHYVAIPKTFQEYEAKVLSTAVKENFKMIKTIPSRTLEIMQHRYTSTLIEEVAKGNLSRGSFQRELEKHKVKNAKLIARTESSKLQTKIEESRAVEVGSVAYEWLSSNDKRTRQSHRDMNGVIVFWRPQEQKPLLDGMRGNAGEFPNCRCDTLTIVDISELTKSTYRVYDYRIDEIITMSKSDLILALKRGSLETSA